MGTHTRSLGKVAGTPEVKRVYISSFWDKPLQEGSNKELFEAEREDLFKELRELPRYSAIRKINDLVKRARHVKVGRVVSASYQRAFLPILPGGLGVRVGEGCPATALHGGTRTQQEEHRRAS